MSKSTALVARIVKELNKFDAVFIVQEMSLESREFIQKYVRDLGIDINLLIYLGVQTQQHEMLPQILNQFQHIVASLQ